MNSSPESDNGTSPGDVFNITLGELFGIAGDNDHVRPDADLFSGDDNRDAIRSAFKDVQPWVAGYLIHLIGSGIENGSSEYGAATPAFKQEVRKLLDSTANTGDPNAECPACNSKNTHSPGQTMDLPEKRSCLDCGEVLPVDEFYPNNRSDSDHNFGMEWRETTDILNPELITRANQSSGAITDFQDRDSSLSVRAVLDTGDRFYRCDIRWAEEFTDNPRVTFKKCHPHSDARVTRKWTSIATGGLSGPQDLESWKHLLTVFETAWDRYKIER